MFTEDMLLVPGEGLFVGSADRVGGRNDWQALELLQVEVLSPGAPDGGADPYLERGRHSEKALVEGPVMPLAQGEAVPGVVRSAGRHGDDVSGLGLHQFLLLFPQEEQRFADTAKMVVFPQDELAEGPVPGFAGRIVAGPLLPNGHGQDQAVAQRQRLKLLF